MGKISKNGIEYGCNCNASGKVTACVLFPVMGVDTTDHVEQAREELAEKFAITVFTTVWRHPPMTALVNIYLDEHSNIIIEGDRANFGNLYYCGWPAGRGVYLNDTRTYLGITKEAVPIFTRLWENAEPVGKLLGKLNWFKYPDTPSAFWWIGPRRIQLRPNDFISRSGDVKISDSLFRII